MLHQIALLNPHIDTNGPVVVIDVDKVIDFVRGRGPLQGPYHEATARIGFVCDYRVLDLDTEWTFDDTVRDWGIHANEDGTIKADKNPFMYPLDLPEEDFHLMVDTSNMEIFITVTDDDDFFLHTDNTRDTIFRSHIFQAYPEEEYERLFPST